MCSLSTEKHNSAFTSALWSAGWLPPALYLLIGMLVFHSILKLPFLTDDYTYLTAFSSKSFFSLFGAAHGFQFFRPLADALFLADGVIWHFNPRGFHLTNLLIHIANSYLVFLLAARWFSAILSTTKSQRIAWLSFSAGLIFLILPGHCEAVAWISGRYDLIAAFFMLLALLASFTFLATPSTTSGIATALFCGAAFLSKESAIALPLLIAGGTFIWRWSQKTPINKNRLVFAPAIISFVLLGAYIAIRFLFIHQWIGGYGSEVHFNPSVGPVFSHLLIAPIKALLFPLPLYLSVFSDHIVWLSLSLVCAFIAGITVVIVRSFKASVFPLVALLVLFFTAFLPAVTLHSDLFGTYGERFLYFPSVFLVIGLIHFISIVINRKSALALAIAVISLGYIGALGRSLRFWSQAGAQAAVLLDEAVTLAKGGSLIVLNLPDNYRGAYIWHLGFPEALAVKKQQLLEVIISRAPVAEQKKLLAAMNSVFSPDDAIASVREKLTELAQPAGNIPGELAQEIRQLQLTPSLDQVRVLTTHPVNLRQDNIRVEKVDRGKYRLHLYSQTNNLEYDETGESNPLFFSEGHLHRY